MPCTIVRKIRIILTKRIVNSMLMMVFEIILRKNPVKPNFQRGKSLILITVLLKFKNSSQIPQYPIQKSRIQKIMGTNEWKYTRHLSTKYFENCCLAKRVHC
jgi:hypothetical protein